MSAIDLMLITNDKTVINAVSSLKDTMKLSQCNIIQKKGYIKNKFYKVNPDVMLIDLDFLDNGLELAKSFMDSIQEVGIIILSSKKDPDIIRRSLVIGVKDFLVKPLQIDEIKDSIQRYMQHSVNERNGNKKTLAENEGKVISIISTKGGVGKTTITTNLGASLAHVYGHRVVLIDLDLQFGDVSVFLNIIPKKSIVELINEVNEINEENVNDYLVQHSSGIYVLPGPLQPEKADLVLEEHVRAIINSLKQCFDFIIIDTPPVFNDPVLMSLELSDEIFVISTLDLPTIKNVKVGLDIMESLKIDTSKIKIILNKSSMEIGITRQEVQKALNYPIVCYLPDSPELVGICVNKGDPFVLSEPQEAITKLFNRFALRLGNYEEVQSIDIHKRKFFSFLKKGAK